MAWLCSRDDAWCGECGAPCAQLALSVRPAILETGQLSPRLYFNLENASCASLDIDGIKKPDWLLINGQQPGKLAPFEKAGFWGAAQTLDMTQPEAAEVVVRTRAGQASTLLMVLEQKPTLVCTPARLEVWASARAKAISLSIAPRTGQLKLHSVSADPAGGLRILENVNDGFIASPVQGAELTIEGNARLSQGQTSASLVAAYYGPHGIEKTPVSLAMIVRNPPQVRWVGRDDPPAERFQRSHQLLEFVFVNQDPGGEDGGSANAELLLTAVTLTPPAGEPGIAPRLLTDLPLHIAGGESETVVFDLNLEEAPSSETVPVSFALQVESNGGSLRGPASVIVRPRTRSFGMLAIDFGSSNTCCAVVERDQPYEMLALDGDNIISPTMVRYMDLDGPMPVIETGARVKALAAVSPRAAASTATELKQRLGEIRQDIYVRADNTETWTHRRASDAASDYLHRIRELVELRRNTTFREFILTHPARCSLRQYRNLSLALRTAFGADEQNQLHFMQEPLAALIPFLADRAERAMQQNAAGNASPTARYTVASFDLGGGTTDIALVRVEHRAPKSTSVEHVHLQAAPFEIRPEIRHCDGVRYGGENLTTYLEQQLRERCEAVLTSQKAGLRLIRSENNKEMSGASIADLRRNEVALRTAAEEFKASLSEEGRQAAPVQLILRVQVAETRDARDHLFDFKALCTVNGSDLQREFLQFARARIEEMAGLLKAAEAKEGEPLDYIQLSGKTAFLPVVREVLAKMFPTTHIKRADKPKECVVAGACLSRSMASRRAARRLILPEGTQRTTSRIGVFNAEGDRFLMILPVDTVVPEEGLSRDHPGHWEGSEPVTIWENLGTADDAKAAPALGPQLNKVGTWEPERTVAVEGPLWALRVTLKGFDLILGAVSPSGEYIAFRPSGGSEA